MGLITAGVRYCDFATHAIYTESTAHLAEIYHQANRSLRSLAGRNWSSMHMWVSYLRDTEDEEKTKAYLKKLEDENGFTDFCFVSREGEYRTADGKTGYLDLKQSLPTLVLRGRQSIELGDAFHAYIIDWRLPDMNGIEVTRHIRALEEPALSGIPIPAMTANAFGEDRKAAAECGMNGFLSKPIQVEEVIQTLRDVLLQR